MTKQEIEAWLHDNNNQWNHAVYVNVDLGPLNILRTIISTESALNLLINCIDEGNDLRAYLDEDGDLVLGEISD